MFQLLRCPSTGELLNLDGPEADVRNAYLEDIHGTCDRESIVLTTSDHVVE